MNNITALTSMDHLDRLLPTALGFEHVFSTLDNATRILSATGSSTFPPVNVIKTDEYNFVVELAVAGYKQDEIEITAERNSLKVSGKKIDEDNRQYLVKGIAGRKFSRQFVLADTVVVRDANLEDGVLSIRLENVIPEEMKPRKIEVKKPALLETKE